ncbi:PREDICTED: uncharacterized protein LOC104759160 [Camelina sativa]|uniref:Uncharacterized protein LOC104759160 n=1 Tax=Camelina sativa TaxID=90675 RepID=A0ABM0X4B6_CAMSA|nr:PREDICTED: uncharacterized protein LOC104759160 [Camelina sativa]
MKKQLRANDVDHQQQQQNLDDPENPHQSSRFFGQSCYSALSRFFSLRCLIVLVVSLAILLPTIFCLFPSRSHTLAPPLSQPHANDTINYNAASVQASFKLRKPVSEVTSQKGALEDEIFRSICLSNDTKVIVLSLRQSCSCKYTDVEFAVVPVSAGYEISTQSLTSLRSSFVNLLEQRSKLNLTTTCFGKPYSFQVLKFPGGISVDPSGSIPVPSFGYVGNILNITLDRSISEILPDNKAQKLSGKLAVTLYLEPQESIYFRLTNIQGSTVSPPVIVQVYLVITIRVNLQLRLDHFAHITQTSSANNLGLENTVFGEVKGITISTNLEGEILDPALVMAPTPTPACYPSLC